MFYFSASVRATALLLTLTAIGACDSSPTQVPAASGSNQPFISSPSATVPPPPGTPEEPASAANPTTPDSLHLLSSDRVGRLRLNTSEKAFLRLIPESRRRKSTRTAEGITYPVYEVTDAQQPTAPPILLEMAGDEQEGFRIWRIRVMDPQYRTADGIGVGSPYGAARQQYGITTIEKTDAGLVAVSDAVNMSWVLDEQSLPPKRPSQMRPTDVPTATRIIGVLVSR
ncbi:hypothetical protein SAMN00120144_2571 [Hymenobacter roseosalivarius DSM 11622]|uniref:Uncharacterized protein n=1 Tax=Hymenobacter roseosalivarius DSM 11622 TaxID=645990 RepID=A0A1W1W488_9BACT|nr:hypothetical protein [Hymenobacter roseosalivarius]SMC00201.1 hypothetical protein SAMN00120144_2571 [Hymenobacter roseosalivarius DSM 11622]